MNTPTMPPATAPGASYDSIILAAVLAECQPLAGAHVQRALQTGPHEVVFSLRARGRPRALLISTDPRWGRLHLTGNAAPAATTAFLQLLRGRLEGSVLRELAAPRFERLVTMTFETLEGPHQLVVEIMGRHSNLILCREGIIVGALRIVGADTARERAVLPQRPYMSPAPPRTTPCTVTAADLTGSPSPGWRARRRRGSENPGAAAPDRAAWRAVLDATGGIGPAVAWEACLRARVDPAVPLDESAAPAVVAALRRIGVIVERQQFSPTLYRDHDRRAVAYAAFPMQCFAHWQAEDSTMSAAVEAVAAHGAVASDLEAQRAALATTVSQARARVLRALDAVADDERHASDAGRVREHGELILAYLAGIQPGQEVLEAPGFDGTPVRISLDPRLSGVENAQAYFKRYARAAAAMKRLPQRRNTLDSERSFLDALATSLTHAETRDDLWEIEQDLVAAGLRRAGRERLKPRLVAEGRIFKLPGGFEARAGRSARENERLTFEVAGPDDLWLHARGMPGAHVIITGGRGEPAETTALAAASIAAHYSSGRRAAKVPVDITKRKHVRRIRGGRPGEVSYTNERTVTVTPALPRLE
jgi:predicted ribosome quality control (RQC) complex YloA/Tae2 family protein